MLQDYEVIREIGKGKSNEDFQRGLGQNLAQFLVQILIE